MSEQLLELLFSPSSAEAGGNAACHVGGEVSDHVAGWQRFRLAGKLRWSHVMIQAVTNTRNGAKHHKPVEVALILRKVLLMPHCAWQELNTSSGLVNVYLCCLIE